MVKSIWRRGTAWRLEDRERRRRARKRGVQRTLFLSVSVRGWRRHESEELLAAAHAACFSMALSVALSQAGYPPVRVHTRRPSTFGRRRTGSPFRKSIWRRKEPFPASMRNIREAGVGSENPLSHLKGARRRRDRTNS